MRKIPGVGIYMMFEWSLKTSRISTDTKDVFKELEIARRKGNANDISCALPLIVDDRWAIGKIKFVHIETSVDGF
jgi:hypothetical protein